MSEDEKSRMRKILDAGSELTGVAAGAGIGFALGGPAGSMVGSAAAVPVRLALQEIAQRMLGKREGVRIGAALEFAGEVYEERLREGDEVRSDEFFAEEPKGRSAAQDFAEGVLITAQQQWEERKVRHLGYMLGNIGFEEQIDGLTAGRALSVARELTWRQYVLLALIGDNENSPLPDVDPFKPQISSWNTWSTYDELNTLITGHNLLKGVTIRTDRLALASMKWDLPGLRLGSGGELIYALLALDKISEQDRNGVRESLFQGSISQD
ncbi:hypothetical protein [Streptomyces sp. cg40]|uniref:hypothetical protein n=1 Tax=Streptomyces sp. cg40 TaxID=3419764 RepID=UPI003D056B4A